MSGSMVTHAQPGRRRTELSSHRPAGHPYGAYYFEMFGGVIGAVARDWGEVAEA